MKQRHTVGAGPGTKADGVLGGGVAQECLGWKLNGRVLGVVNEEVNTVDQTQGGFVVLAESVRAWSELHRV